ncbi:proline--tRNA ligase [Methanococcus maripaludis]|uniref:Proline--tRNA ligase n=1 Tax=Methanococcus maripaludis TaxID=39152 RepID=A0A2L1C8J7_METMI|nr:proline--tRNA ligase [Methanococcus maripaludis]AAG28517.1 prolyl-tRNA synthetase [Methanococcus maripaludis]AVB75698.1 Proline--tRNA ligase [Methanococcus maripaludis]MBA2864114.1 prolyl-tRNA synthetase [Methanococcus maripaludis]MBB6497040.1 prolyl-tRNA synthetase [Methanococcus maripaludis]
MEFSEWYSDILEKAGIYDLRYPIKGCGVYLPYGFKIRRYSFEILRKLLDETGHDETLFPMLIPENLLAKEGEHIKGFEDEVFWVTHGGKTPLEVKLALRPTSETTMYYMMKQWIKVHTDLPLKLYQVVNTFRYETKHTRPLIRLREIMSFKEAHTAHATKKECDAQIEEALTLYKAFFDEIGVPYVISKRPEWDKFPGADYTMAFDTIYPDGKTMQIGTVHNLGQNFAKTFELEFETPDGEKDFVYQTCYGISDRAIASLISVHGDEKGLVIPVDVAPIQIVLIPLLFKGKEEIVMDKIKELNKTLKSEFRVHLDDRDIRPGRKYNDWELKGVPLRIELGPRDIENGHALIVRRDTGEKITVEYSNILEEVEKIVSMYKDNLKIKAEEKIKSFITVVDFESDVNALSEKVKAELLENKGIILIPFEESIYNEEFEELIDASVLGLTTYEGKEYISVARTY